MEIRRVKSIEINLCTDQWELTVGDVIIFVDVVCPITITKDYDGGIRVVVE